jgi:glycosyltransferase involved in cell wall biosynthesis
MRILQVTTSADPKQGGVSEGIRQQSSHLLSLGHEVEILSVDPKGSEFIESYPLPIYPVGPASGGFAKTSQTEAWIVENGARFDGIIGNGLWQHPNLALRNAARKLGKPYWIYTHGMLDPWFNRAYPLKRLKKTLYWPWQHAVLRDAEAVLFTCEEERLLARESFRPYHVRERVVNYGIADPVGEPEAQRVAFSAAFPFLVGKRFLLFLSRVHPKKGVDLLLQAFAKENDPDLHLAIAGPVTDEYRSELSRLVAGTPAEARVHWLGMLQGDLKWGAFRSAEAFVLTSHQENFGIAVAEALACGTPVIITRPVNIWREIEADKAGVVGDDTLPGVEDLLSRWRTMHPVAKISMGEAARRCFLDRFTIGRSATSLIQTLEEGLAARGRRP